MKNRSKFFVFLAMLGAAGCQMLVFSSFRDQDWRQDDMVAIAADLLPKGEQQHEEQDHQDSRL